MTVQLSEARAAFVSEAKRWMEMDQRWIEILGDHVARLASACNAAIVACEDDGGKLPSSVVEDMKRAVIMVSGDSAWTRPTERKAA